MSFSKDFVWGAATAAYQIEGAIEEDGKGLSVWDVACRREGYVKQGHTGQTACDHYHRFDGDVDIMKQIGLHAYRFSVSWPRVLPEGIGRVNEKGLDFYDRLVDELLKHDIEPYLTLFHWDYPHELFKRGGWLNPDSSQWFAEYTRVIVDRLSDRVHNWFTLNEPQCFINFGHLTGRHAPCLKLELGEALLASHNALLAHGKAVQTIRQYGKTPAKIGWAPQGHISYPISDSEEDLDAARKNMFAIKQKNLSSNTWWMDPVYKGEYPADGLELFGSSMPTIRQDDMEIISQPLDFFGANCYNGYPVKSDENGNSVFGGREVGHPESVGEWPVTFDCLYWGAKFFYERYGLPFVVAENGMPNCDWVATDGHVHDGPRVDFLYRNIAGLMKAANEQIPLGGYFCWSLMDNMEWMHGYTKRFGLVHVDYITQKRTIKDSGHFYKQIIASNGEILCNP
ncbi:MAG: GH1 family beta-glucosidase [Oscillospiraceae bacterium]|nr:GH1 family beta-glucosidase [Oscillospiraceae bacterium]